MSEFIIITNLRKSHVSQRSSSLSQVMSIELFLWRSSLSFRWIDYLNLLKTVHETCNNQRSKNFLIMTAGRNRYLSVINIYFSRKSNYWICCYVSKYSIKNQLPKKYKYDTNSIWQPLQNLGIYTEISITRKS